MPNPTADFPNAVHEAVDTEDFGDIVLGGTDPTHTELHGKIEQEIVAVQQKVGTGGSTPSSGQVLVSNSNGASAWRALTSSDVGLSNVNNTADANKPVSSAQAAAIALVQADIDVHEARTDNPHSVTKSQVNLSNVDNTSDLNKPISTATQSALNTKVQLGGDLAGSITAPLVRSRTAVTAGGPDSEADFITSDYDSDDEALQAAIDSIPSGEVYALPYRYMIENRLVVKNYLAFRGGGIGATILAGTTALGNHAVISTAGTIDNPKVGISLREFEIDGSEMDHTGYSSGRKGTVLNYMEDLLIDRIYIHDTPATGMGIDFLVDGIIVNNIVNDCGTAGQGISSGSNGYGLGIGAWGKEPTIIANNVARGNANAAYVIENILGTGTVQSKNFIFEINQAYENKYGVYVGGGGGGIISGNIIEGNTAEGLHFGQDNNFQSDTFLIENNHIRNNGLAGMRLDRQECKNFQIKGNNISGNGGYGIISKGEYTSLIGNHIYNNQLTGFYMELTAGTTHKHLTFIGNHVFNNGLANTSGENDGIRIGGGSVGIEDVIIQGNQIYDDQAVPTQRYGVILTGTLTDVDIINNHFKNNKTAAIYQPELASRIHGNTGVANNALALNEGGTGATTAAAARTNLELEKGVANGVATLDSGGKVPSSQLPLLALTDTSVVASQAAQLALTAEEGDVAIRTDLNKSYIHNGGTAGTMADWSELLTPTDSVLSVNGYTGAVTLAKSDIGLGNVENAALSTWAGSSNITTLGTISTGTWSATAIAVAKGGTGATDTSTARANLGLAIGSNVQAYDADLDTWAAKTAPSSTVVGTTDTQTLTNKRLTKRTGTTASSATPTINTDNVDYYSITALAAAITSFTSNLSGTPTEGQTLWIAITDDGTARAITWGASFESSTVLLPTTTVVSTRLDAGFIWNSVTSKWRCVAVA